MTLTYTRHEKISLRKHPQFNEAWLHDRICEDTSLLGFGDVRVLDRERSISGAGRLDNLALLGDTIGLELELQVLSDIRDAIPPNFLAGTLSAFQLKRGIE